MKIVLEAASPNYKQLGKDAFRGIGKAHSTANKFIPGVAPTAAAGLAAGAYMGKRAAKNKLIDYDHQIGNQLRDSDVPGITPEMISKGQDLANDVWQNAAGYGAAGAAVGAGAAAMYNKYKSSKHDASGASKADITAQQQYQINKTQDQLSSRQFRRNRPQQNYRRRP